MIRSILIQIWNRRRSNAWITVELLLVFVIVWFITDYFFALGYNYNIKSHLEVRHTWQLNIGELPVEHPQYSAEEAEAEARLENFKRIVRLVQDSEEVEALGISYSHAAPGSGNYNGSTFYSQEDTSLFINPQVRRLDSEHDYLNVFGYTDGAGKKKVLVGDYDYSGQRPILLSRSAAEKLYKSGSAVGKNIMSSKKEDATVYSIAGVVGDIKRMNNERPQESLYRMIKLNLETLDDAEISIRSRASTPDAVFAERFSAEMQEKLSVGNWYFKNATPYAKIVSDTEAGWGITSSIRLMTGLMVFFLVNILLCLIGTFWYRVNVRRNEIGLRKAMGASSRGIHGMFILEGLLLLAIAAIPAMALEFNLAYADMVITPGRDTLEPELYLPDRMALRFIITNSMTLALMAAVTVLAIWLPARKASRMLAAEALHYE